MSDYTTEQITDPTDPDCGKWLIIDRDGWYINEDRPFDTETEAINWIPEYEEEMYQRHIERLIEDGETQAERDENHHNNQRLK